MFYLNIWKTAHLTLLNFECVFFLRFSHSFMSCHVLAEMWVRYTLHLETRLTPQWQKRNQQPLRSPLPCGLPLPFSLIFLLYFLLHLTQSHLIVKICPSIHCSILKWCLQSLHIASYLRNTLKRKVLRVAGASDVPWVVLSTGGHHYILTRERLRQR